MAYLIGDALFVGDTLFVPDAGTARCDFPFGDEKSLYESCQRLPALPESTRVFVCHDYQPGAGNLPSTDVTGRLFLKVSVNALGGAALDRFASEE